MTVTNAMRSLVSQGMRDVSINKSELAEKMGVERSWVSQFFREKNGLQKLDKDHRRKLERVLGIKFYSTSDRQTASDLALKIDSAMSNDSRISESLALLVSAINDNQLYALPQLSDKDLGDLGTEVIRSAAMSSEGHPEEAGEAVFSWFNARLDLLGKGPTSATRKKALLGNGDTVTS